LAIGLLDHGHVFGLTADFEIGLRIVRATRVSLAVLSRGVGRAEEKSGENGRDQASGYNGQYHIGQCRAEQCYISTMLYQQEDQISVYRGHDWSDRGAQLL